MVPYVMPIMPIILPIQRRRADVDMDAQMKTLKTKMQTFGQDSLFMSTEERHLQAARMLAHIAGSPQPATPPPIPPLPATQPPILPSSPTKPPPLPDQEEDPEPGHEDDDDDSDEDDDDGDYDADDEEEEESLATLDGPGDFAQNRAEGMEDHLATLDVLDAGSKAAQAKELALKTQLEEDQQRYGSKSAALIMQSARETKADQVAGKDPHDIEFPREQISKLAEARGLDVQKTVDDAEAGYRNWVKYSKYVKAKIDLGIAVTVEETEKLKQLGMECTRVPALLMGIPGDIVESMLTEINGQAETQADIEAGEISKKASEVVESVYLHYKEDPDKTLACLSAAVGYHLLGFQTHDLRRRMMNGHVEHLQSLLEEQEKTDRKE